MHAVVKMAKFCQNLLIGQADFILMNLTKICQNHQFSAKLILLRQNLAKICQNCKIYKHSLTLTNLPFLLLHAFLDISDGLPL